MLVVSSDLDYPYVYHHELHPTIYSFSVALFHSWPTLELLGFRPVVVLNAGELERVMAILNQQHHLATALVFSLRLGQA